MALVSTLRLGARVRHSIIGRGENISWRTHNLPGWNHSELSSSQQKEAEPFRQSQKKISKRFMKYPWRWQNAGWARTAWPTSSTMARACSPGADLPAVWFRYTRL